MDDTTYPDLPDPLAALDEPVQQDYFGCDETYNTVLPDGVSFVTHKKLAEGERRKYVNKSNREMTVNRQSGNATLSLAPGDERFNLLSVALVGWNLKRNGVAVPFDARQLSTWLDKADPRVLDLVERDVRAKNPWLLADLTVEDLDREIATLEEQRSIKAKEAEGNVPSVAQ